MTYFAHVAAIKYIQLSFVLQLKVNLKF